MAPQTKATPEQSAQLRDINREYRAVLTGSTIEPRELVFHKNKRPKINADVGSKSGEDIEVFIADPWPIDYAAQEANEKERRIIQGQGALRQTIALVNGKEWIGPALHPTRKHWTRGERRAKARAQRLARKVMRRRAK